MKWEDVQRLVAKLDQTIALDSEEELCEKKNAAFASILGELWEGIVGPVVRALESDESAIMTPQYKKRIWWIPTSVLWKLPLHAAGIYQPAGEKLSDRFISSYAPSLSTLLSTIRAHKAQEAQKHSPSLMVVTVPAASQEQTLESLDEEVESIMQGASDAAELSLISGSDANPDLILSLMTRHSWVHFACHGHQDHANPFDSCFKTFGSPLHLHDIIRSSLPNAELAFLAACHSAAGDLTTPDESIHLAAGMQFIGYRSVVGTMWAMADVDGPVLAREFYKHMFRKKGRRGRVDCKDAVYWV
jgi:CHAT domain-containing protein